MRALKETSAPSGLVIGSLFLLFATLLSGCATRVIRIPTDPGLPSVDAIEVYQSVSKDCKGVKTLTAEIALSGTVRGERIRGRVLAGFAMPASMRLEGVAPFGAPVFILTSNPRDVIFLLPRDNRVVRQSSTEDILNSLMGLSFTVDDLLSILTGCIVSTPQVEQGFRHDKDWISVILRDNTAAVYLKQVGASWEIRAAKWPGWRVEYSEWKGGIPRIVRLWSDSTQNPVALLAELSQLEVNVPLKAEVFLLDVPRSAVTLTLDELWDVAPLR